MQERSLETRGHILRSAEKLFSQFGYDATCVAEICTEAHVSKGAFFHHFPTKHDVFMALLEDWLEMLDQQIRTLDQNTQPVTQTLIRMGGMLSYIFQSTSDRLHMFLEFWAQASRDEKVWKATIAPYRRYHQVFTEIVQRGVDEGSLKSDQPEATAWIILALAAGILMQGLLYPKGAAWDKVGQHGLEVLMQGLAREN
jgi:AcrR family transcriptional regulator